MYLYIPPPLTESTYKVGYPLPMVLDYAGAEGLHWYIEPKALTAILAMVFDVNAFQLRATFKSWGRRNREFDMTFPVMPNKEDQPLAIPMRIWGRKTRSLRMPFKVYGRQTSTLGIPMEGIAHFKGD